MPPVCSDISPICSSSSPLVVLGLFGLHGLARRYAQRTIALADGDGNLYDRAYGRELGATVDADRTRKLRDGGTSRAT